MAGFDPSTEGWPKLAKSFRSSSTRGDPPGLGGVAEVAVAGVDEMLWVSLRWMLRLIGLALPYSRLTFWAAAPSRRTSACRIKSRRR